MGRTIAGVKPLCTGFFAQISVSVRGQTKSLCLGVIARDGTKCLWTSDALRFARYVTQLTSCHDLPSASTQRGTKGPSRPRWFGTMQ
jgi:hypothetical protein